MSSDRKILIIEDDSTLGKAILEAFNRAGYNAKLCKNSAQALAAIRLGEFDGYVVDCMLPDASGVELAQKIGDSQESPKTVVLTSGVFKDKNYAKEALQRSKATAFLNKPFQLQELLTIFNNSQTPSSSESLDPIRSFMTQNNSSYRDKINAMNASTTIHGYNLPFIYSLLMDPLISGTLKIQYSSNESATIGFNQGRIDEVQLSDKESYFGVLLLEKGFVTHEELAKELKKSSRKKPIGESLADDSAISPHAIDVIRHDQMIIRMSKSIQNTEIKIQFTQTERPETEIAIDSILYLQLISDWIKTKISFDWLKSYYLPWLQHKIVRGPEANKLVLMKSLPVAKGLSIRLFDNNLNVSLIDAISQSENEEDAYRALHLYACMSALTLEAPQAHENNSDVLLSRFKKILESMKDKNHYEVLGLNQNARATEINRAYLEFAKSLHPDALPSQSSDELKRVAQLLFTRITEANRVLSNESTRKDYNKSMKVGEAHLALELEGRFEEALRLLKANHFPEARIELEKIIKDKGHRSDAMVYYIWALLKEKRRRVEREKLAAMVQPLFDKIAHEDRHSPQYFFIKGMYLELTRQIEKAYQLFKHALSLDPSFLDSRREIQYLKEHYGKKSSSTSSGDGTSFLTGIFKKKSS